MDKRKSSYKKFNKAKQFILSGEMACVLILLFFYCIAFSVLVKPTNTSPQPVEQKKTVEVVKSVEAVETPCDFDPITYIRCSGEKLGKDNKTIMTMIRIAKAESGLRPRAKNSKSTASGIFQIIYGTWNSNDCQGNAFNFVNNIDCAWKIQTARGFQPWEVWNKGLVK